VLVPSQENKRSCTYVSLRIFNWIFGCFLAVWYFSFHVFPVFTSSLSQES
jgi:cellulose synthase/poly-beta-1,6-N-acetylglucosamine synthase-like glycosyltransferase